MEVQSLKKLFRDFFSAGKYFSEEALQEISSEKIYKKNWKPISELELQDNRKVILTFLKNFLWAVF